MNDQVLEGLLIDQEMGELDDRCASLLDAYVSDHPSIRPQRIRLQETLAMARGVMAPVGQSATLPPFPKLRVARTLRFRRIATLAGSGAALAACLVLGIAVGQWDRSSATLPSRPSAAHTQPTNVHVPPAAAPSSELARRIVDRRLSQAQSPRSPQKRVQWSDLFHSNHGPATPQGNGL